jgi:uncharacterized protein (DUF849 family)
MIQACLNGARVAGEHPALPLSPAELARDSAACVAAGARSLHLHPRAQDGAETLAPGPVAEAIRAIRTVVPRTEISLSTGLWIVGDDVAARRAAVAGWTERPDLVSLNFSEPGWEELAALLTERGIAIEAGLGSVADAEALAASGLVATWGRGRSSAGSGRRHPPVRRVLVEVEAEGDDPAATVALAAAIDATLDRAAVAAPRLHHGFGPATWAVLDAAVARGHEIRIGLEDVLTLPDGTPAAGNAALVAAAVARYPAAAT